QVLRCPSPVDERDPPEVGGRLSLHAKRRLTFHASDQAKPVRPGKRVSGAQTQKWRCAVETFGQSVWETSGELDTRLAGAAAAQPHRRIPPRCLLRPESVRVRAYDFVECKQRQFRSCGSSNGLGG
ncbi:MAG: hypothetical protein ACM3ZE_23545, partial [Myxococcales bacterium]